MQLEQLQNIPVKRRQTCVACDARLGKAVVELPKFPLTEFYTTQRIAPIGFADQAFHFCENCGHGQLENLVPPRLLYSDSYMTRTSTSHSAIAAITTFKNFVEQHLPSGELSCLVDVGCNDTYFLQQFESRFRNLWGIDPILAGKENELKNDRISLIGDFIENISLKDHKISPSVVVSSHTFEHIDEPKRVIGNLLRQCPDETVFFFQFPGLEGLLQDARFDQIYHQHYNYFSLQSIAHLLRELDAELLSHDVNPYHWSALMIAFQKRRGKKNATPMASDFFRITKKYIREQYELFQSSMVITAKRIDLFEEERIFGFGAALMLPVLNYHLDQRLLKLECILDQDQNKVGKYYINVPVQIRDPAGVANLESAVVILTATMSLDAGRQIIPMLIKQNVKKIIVPMNLI